MVRSLYRYQKEHQKKITVSFTLWKKLREEADRNNMTIPSFIEFLLNEYIKSRTESKKEFKDVKGLVRFGVR